MKYYVELDENDYLLSFMKTDTDKDDTELEPLSMDLAHLNCYHYDAGEVTLDEVKYAEVLAREKEADTHQENIDAQTLKMAEMFVKMGVNVDDFLDRLDAQVLYSALMTDTLIESEEEVDE